MITVQILPAATDQPQPPLDEWAEQVLTLPLFRAWLEARVALKLGGEATVGFACNSALCPLATYLQTLLPDSTINVFSQMAVLYVRPDEQVNVLLPTWAGRFVHEVDRLKDVTLHNRVTAAQALAILRHIKAEDAALASVLRGKEAY